MNSRLWLAIGFGLILGVVGYLIGKSQVPSVPPPPPPPPPVAASCVGNAVLTYDAVAKKLTVDQKPYRVVRPAMDATSKAACWSLRVINSETEVEFEKLKINLRVPLGRNGKPVVVGDPDFRGGAKVVWVRFDDEPVWSDVNEGGQTHREVKFPYDIEAKVKNVADPITVDPDMILRKSG
ncbi:MAG: hypothetical protein ACREQY_07390 [Candidatus Binatia bacterium]